MAAIVSEIAKQSVYVCSCRYSLPHICHVSEVNSRLNYVSISVTSNFNF